MSEQDLPPVYRPEPVEPPPFQPTCMRCGRADHTVRLVEYPYVVSLILVSYRRAFTGRWCSRCRTPRWAAASLITAIIGWFGFPFGLLMTPVALFELVRGGRMPAHNNASIQRSLGEAKLRGGDYPGARRCFEASLRFQDDPTIRQQLGDLYRAAALAQPNEINPLLPGLLVGALLILAGALGLFAGLVDTALAYLVFGNVTESNLFLDILSWTPLVALGVVTAVILHGAVDALFTFLRLHSRILAKLIPLLAALAAVYGMLTGRSAVIFFDSIRNFNHFTSLADTFLSSAAIFLRGGLLELRSHLVLEETYQVIYLILLAGLFLLIMFSLDSAASQVAAWQRRLAAIAVYGAERNQPSAGSAWLTLMGAPLVMGTLAFLLPQHALVDYLEAMQLSDQAYQLYSAGEYERAIHASEQAVALRPEEQLYQIDLGWIYLYNGQFEQGREVFNRVLASHPEDLDAITGLGVSFYWEEMYPQAEEVFSQLVRTNPEAPEFHDMLGWSLYYQGDYPDALAEFQRVLDLQPEYLDIWVAFGLVYLESEQYAESFSAFTKALERNDQSAGAYDGLCRLHFSRNRFDQAIEACQKAIELDPQQVISQFSLGYSYWITGEAEKAITTLQQGMQAFPEWGGSPAMLAFIYLESGQEEAAAQAEAQALELGQGDPNVLYWLAALSAHQNKYQESVERLQQALAINTEDNAYLYASLAQSQMMLGEMEQAYQTLEQGFQSNPDDPDLILALASLAIQESDLDKALQEIDRMLAAGGDEWDAAPQQSFIYLQQGDLQAAITTSQATLEKYPYDTRSLTTLALALHASGQTEAACPPAERAVQLAPLRDTSHYALGLCYLARGDEAAAASELQRFLELYWPRSYVDAYQAEALRILDELGVK